MRGECERGGWGAGLTGLVEGPVDHVQLLLAGEAVEVHSVAAHADCGAAGRGAGRVGWEMGRIPRTGEGLECTD